MKSNNTNAIVTTEAGAIIYFSDDYADGVVMPPADALKLASDLLAAASAAQNTAVDAICL